MRRHRFTDGPDGAQVGLAALGLRSADGNENELGVLDAGGQVGAEAQTLLAGIAHDQFEQARLVDRYFSRFEGRDLAGVLIDADNFIAALRQASRGDEPDISSADDCDFQDTRSFHQSWEIAIILLGSCGFAHEIEDIAQALVPPSTVRLAPVMYDDSGPAMNATSAATSSTVP